MSKAIIPVQPEKPTYHILDLWLYPRYDRASYEAATGQQAPPFDATKPVKMWSAEDATAFTVFDGAKFGNLTMTGDEALAVNLPGAYRYMAYLAPANVASFVFADGSTQNIASGFTRLADAQLLASSIVPGASVAEQISPIGTAYHYANEGSRLYDIIFAGGVKWPAHALMVALVRDGIGHAGTWGDPTKGFPVFQPAPDYTQAQPSTPPEIGIPCRALFDGEVLQVGGFSPVIVRVDKQPPPSPAGGSFTDADRASLARIEAILGKIGQLFGL